MPNKTIYKDLAEKTSKTFDSIFIKKQRICKIFVKIVN